MKFFTNFSKILQMAAERESAIIVDMRDLYCIRHINFLIFFLKTNLCSIEASIMILTSVVLVSSLFTYKIIPTSA